MDKRRQKTKLNDENRRAKRQNEIPLATEPEPTEMEIDQNHENSENPEIQEIRLEGKRSVKENEKCKRNPLLK